MSERQINMDFVIISKSEYDRLVRDSQTLEFLQALGVDNWSGYRTPPDREDYETDEEYESAYEAALTCYD
jgi:hypothetical protein